MRMGIAEKVSLSAVRGQGQGHSEALSLIYNFRLSDIHRLTTVRLDLFRMTLYMFT